MKVRVGMKFPVEGEMPPDSGRIVKVKVVKETKTTVRSTRVYQETDVVEVGQCITEMLDRYSTKSLRLTKSFMTGNIAVHAHEVYWKVEQEG